MLKKILILGFYSYLFFIFGCSTDTLIQDKPKPVTNSCVTGLKDTKIQYYYMHQGSPLPYEDWPIFASGTGVKFLNAFKLRAGLSPILQNVAGVQKPYGIINTFSGSSNDITQGLNNYYNATFITGNDYPYYMCGIDSISANTYWPGSFGYSYRSSWSFVFSGYIYKRSIYSTNWPQIAELVGTHELAHQIAVNDEGSQCSGTYSQDTCVMHPNNDLSQQYDSFIAFCDYHGCLLFNQLDLKTKNKNNALQMDKTLMTASTGYEKQSEDIAIQFSLDKYSYYENEGVILSIKIKNQSEMVDSIKNFHEYGFASHIKLIDKFGIVLPYDFLIVDGFPTYSVIMPGEEINYNIDITRTHGNTNQESYDPVNKKYLPLGNYSIEFLGDIQYFKKDLTVNPISFEVINPTELENYALSDLRKIYKIKDFVERSLKYRDFVLNHLKSAYMEQVFSDYLSIGVSDQVEKYVDTILEDCIWFIGVKPNSLLMHSVLRDCLVLFEKYKSKSDSKEFLQKVIIEYPNTLANKEAMRLLDKLY